MGFAKYSFVKSKSIVGSIMVSISEIREKLNYINTQKMNNNFIQIIYSYMKESIINQCLDILKTDDVRNEIKVIFSPVTDLILYEIYPYIYVIISLVFMIFILILANLCLLIFIMRNKKMIFNI